MYAFSIQLELEIFGTHMFTLYLHERHAFIWLLLNKKTKTATDYSGVCVRSLLMSDKFNLF